MSQIHCSYSQPAISPSSFFPPRHAPDRCLSVSLSLVLSLCILLLRVFMGGSPARHQLSHLRFSIKIASSPLPVSQKKNYVHTRCKQQPVQPRRGFTTRGRGVHPTAGPHMRVHIAPQPQLGSQERSQHSTTRLALAPIGSFPSTRFLSRHPFLIRSRAHALPSLLSCSRHGRAPSLPCAAWPFRRCCPAPGVGGCHHCRAPGTGGHRLAVGESRRRIPSPPAVAVAHGRWQLPVLCRRPAMLSAVKVSSCFTVKCFRDNS